MIQEITDKKEIIMRNIVFMICLSLVFFSCNNEEHLEDSDASQIYIPASGFSIHKAWESETGTDLINIDVYCSGLRKGGNGISVGYEVDESLITKYNQDITQKYSGDIEMLPAKYWSVESNKIDIPKGEVQGSLVFKIDTKGLKESGLYYNQVKYAIPIRLTNTSEFKLHESEEKISAIVGVTLNKPVFYFGDNRNGQNTLSMRLLYAKEPIVNKYLLVSEGIDTDREYTVDIEPNPDFLADNQELLPNDAWKLETNKIKFEKGFTEASLPITLFPDKIQFLKTFYLPLTISSVSNYYIDKMRSTLLLRIEVKNDYEWAYESKMLVINKGTGRSSTHQVGKKPVSISHDEIQMQMATDKTIAGYKANNKYFNLKIIPTDNKNKWNVELKRIKWSPKTLELTPDKESYYDWERETFHLFYRFKDYYDDTRYIEVEEIMEAQF